MCCVVDNLNYFGENLILQNSSFVYDMIKIGLRGHAVHGKINADRIGAFAK